MSNGNAKKIIVHCSASSWGSAIEIDKWHRERGWREIGYHAVIMNGFPDSTYWKENRMIKIYNGSIERGRKLDADDQIETWEQGAHAYGYNQNTLAVCLIGGRYQTNSGEKMEMFTKLQIVNLVKLIKLWQFQFRVATNNIYGHCELPGVTKTCPDLNMDKIRKLVDNKTEGIRLLKSIQLKEVY